MTHFKEISDFRMLTNQNKKKYSMTQREFQRDI